MKTAQKLATIYALAWHCVQFFWMAVLSLLALAYEPCFQHETYTVSKYVFTNCWFLCLCGKKPNTVKSRHTLRKPWDHLKSVNHAMKTVITVFFRALPFYITHTYKHAANVKQVIWSRWSSCSVEGKRTIRNWVESLGYWTSKCKYSILDRGILQFVSLFWFHFEKLAVKKKKKKKKFLF